MNLPELQFKMLVDHNIEVPLALKSAVLGEDAEMLKVPFKEKSK